MEQNLNNLVNGDFVEGSTSERIDVFNPARPDQKVGSVPSMTKEDLEQVFAAATAGATTWKKTGSLERGKVLLRAAELIRELGSDALEIRTGEGRAPLSDKGRRIWIR